MKVYSLLFLLMLTASCNRQDKSHLSGYDVSGISTIPGGSQKVSLAGAPKVFGLSPLPTQVSEYVRCIYQDKSGDIWFGTNDEGVYLYNGDTFVNFTGKDGFAGQAVRGIVQDEKGDLWFATDAGVSRYDGKTFTTYTILNGLSHNDVWSTLKDSKGNLWFGTMGGVSRYDGKNFTSIPLPAADATSPSGVTPTLVGSIFARDCEVSRYDGKTFTTTYTFKDGHACNSLPKDQKANVALGMAGTTSGTSGASCSPGKTFASVSQPATNVSGQSRFTPTLVWAIYEDKAGNIWFGTDGGGVRKYDGTSFTTYTDKDGLAYNNVRTILEDKAGNMWFGTWGGGASRYDGTTFTNYTAKDGLASNNIWTMYEDNAGSLWFGTLGSGASRYDGQAFTTFTENKGLTNNYIQSILQDKKGNLWFGFSGGAFLFDGKSFLNFVKSGGC